MLLSHCPNCQHDNPPGERFCAACGVPLDLKPCPVCGKVDSAKATECSGCGAHFPAVAGLTMDMPDVSGDAAPARTAGKPAARVVTPPSSATRALPLIVVALAAGGIPLLWLYRNTMPVPKAWQAPESRIESPSLIPQVAAPAPPAPQVTPVAPQPQPPAIAETRPAEPQAKPVSAIPAAPEKPAEKVSRGGTPPEKAPAKPTTRPVAKPAEAKPAQPTPPAKAPTAECTEALAAVGLCDPKAGK